jgi:hypothetical protein
VCFINNSSVAALTPLTTHPQAWAKHVSSSVSEQEQEQTTVALFLKKKGTEHKSSNLL